MKKLWVYLTLLLAVSGCSTQYREATPQITSEELFSLIAEIQNEVSDPQVRALNVDELSKGNASTIFHARDSAGRPAVSVLSMADMGVFESGLVGVPSSAIGLSMVDVVFIDSVDANGARNFSLLMKWEELDINGQSSSFAYGGSGLPDSAFFSDDKFEVAMVGANGETIILRTSDLSEKYDEELASAIKLTVYVIDAATGEEFYAGQISTMAGFGNR